MSKGVRHSQHLIISLHKERISSLKNNLQGILPTFMFEYLLIINSFGSLCTDGIYSQNSMSDVPLLYSTI